MKNPTELFCSCGFSLKLYFNFSGSRTHKNDIVKLRLRIVLKDYKASIYLCDTFRLFTQRS